MYRELNKTVQFLWLRVEFLPTAGTCCDMVVATAAWAIRALSVLHTAQPQQRHSFSGVFRQMALQCARPSSANK